MLTRRLLLTVRTAALLQPAASFAEKKPSPKLAEQLSEKLAQDQQQAKAQYLYGRAWKAEELRLKSNEDLHKLWYVVLKEKNVMLSEKNLWDRTSTQQNKVIDRRLKSNLQKVSATMSRITTVMAERQKVRDDYRRQLEEEYIDKKRKELDQHRQSVGEPDLPDITWRLMKEKMRDLRKGLDNTDYIDR